MKFVKAKLEANREEHKWDIMKASEANRLRKKVKKVIGHYSSLKGTIKEMCSE